MSKWLVYFSVAISKQGTVYQKTSEESTDATTSLLKKQIAEAEETSR